MKTTTYIAFSLILLLLQSLPITTVAAALKGTVYDHKGEPLPFASIYIEGTSIGTTTNMDGHYNLELKEGTYIILYQYVGYQQHSETVTMGNQPITIDVRLTLVDVEMGEVVIKSGEDPAYEIIRQAIKKRKYYLTQVKNYNCDSYVKGTQRIKDLPEKIMGRSLAEYRETLDSMGNGIVYLSESVSKLYFDLPEYKEVMISSKVSGNDNGFSFNSGAALMAFNFYENQVTLGDTKLLSPIAQSALGYYKYRLVTTFKDGARLINKVEVIPKNPLGPIFHGHIYIVEGEWSIHSTELKTTGKAANISMLDTVEFRQMHLPVQDSLWRLFSQEIEFTLKAFGITIFGRFIGVFRNYEINPDLGNKFFNAEVFKVNEDANKRDNIYWDSIRPLPLTPEELLEYRTKDSLQKIWRSKEYLDSMDRISNRPSFSMFLTGYTYQNSHKRWRITIPTPLTSFSFNTVQGIVGHLETTFTKDFNEDRTRRMDIHGMLEYGFSDQQLRGFGRFRFKFNDLDDARLEVEGGRRTQQFNGMEPITPLVNSLYSLFLRRNYMKLYERVYGKVQYAQRIMNGLYMEASLAYSQRNPLVNHSDLSLYKRAGRSYFSNVPTDYESPPLADAPYFSPHQHLLFNVFMRIRFAQKFISYPNRRFHIDSKYPEIWLTYTKGIPLLGGDTDFDFLAVTLQKDELSIGAVGLMTIRGKYGVYLNQRRMEFIDYTHFSGNQTVVAKSDMHWRSYQLLPYYQYSTGRWFVEGHFQHDFNGFIWSKLPLVKHLGFEVVAGYHFLYTPEQKDYMEFTIGLDRLGWKLFRFGRVDFVTAYKVGEKPKFGAVFALAFSL